MTLNDDYKKLAEKIDEGFEYCMDLEPAPGSALASDDEYLAPHQRMFSELIQFRLLAAFDHLELVVTARSEDGNVHAFAQTSLLRSVITASSTALWLGLGTTEDRRMKALQLIAKDHKEHRAFLNTLKRDPNAHEPADVEAELQTINAQAKAVFGAARLLDPDLKKNQLEGLTEVAIINGAGKSFNDSEFGKHNPSVLLEAQWRVLSGYVHAYPWASKSIRSVREVRPDEAVVYEFRGDPEFILELSKSCLAVATRAINVYNYLARHPAY